MTDDITLLPSCRNTAEFERFLYEYLHDMFKPSDLDHAKSLAFRMCHIFVADDQLVEAFHKEIYEKIRYGHRVHFLQTYGEARSWLYADIRLKWNVLCMGIDSEIVEVCEI